MIPFATKRLLHSTWQAIRFGFNQAMRYDVSLWDLLMKKNSVLPAILGILALSASQLAMADHVNVGINIGARPAPVVVAPAPVYIAPAPVYAAPAPVYVAPAPTYVAAAPAARVSVSIGWHGNNYWDGHRYWTRQEWQAHHPDPWRR